MPQSQSVPTTPVAAIVVAVIALLSGSGGKPAKVGSAAGVPPRTAVNEGVEPRGDALRNQPQQAPEASMNDPRWPFDQFWKVAKADAGEQLAQELIARRDSIAPEFMVALVPDPIDSRFGYRFDGVVDDIQMAVESLGWNFDRFWLPWQPSGQQPSRRDALGAESASPPAKEKGFSVSVPGLGGFAVRGEYGTATGDDKLPGLLHERHPGVMLFRKPRPTGDRDPRQQLLVVFLVGERPTSGVHKAALGQAFNIIDFVKRGTTDRHLASAREIDIPIVGPYFTGCERSLAYVISEWTSRRRRDLKPACASWRFAVRTGGSNRIDRRKFISDAVHEGSTDVVVEFDATLHHFDRVMGGLLDYLVSRNGHWPLGKVAILTESDTEFGNIEMPLNPNVQITFMKFPFHVSQVAIAYDQSKQAEDRAATPALARSSKLRIPFDETGNPRDIVPALSPAMSAASDEFDLAKILETIAMEDYRYVGIIATDTRDVIFLSGLIREYSPDVQLFTPVGDLLLGHPTYASQLRGMIVASSYPLFSMAQRWDPPYGGDKRRHLFIHETDQGYYNATLSLLGDREKLVASREKGQDKGSLRPNYYDRLYDYGKPFGVMDEVQAALRPASEREDLRPRVWIGVVGQRGLWPLHFDGGSDSSPEHRDYAFRLSAPDETKAKRSSRSEKERFVPLIPLIPQFSWSWGIMVLGVCVVAWAIFYSQFRVAILRKPPSGFLEIFRPIGAREVMEVAPSTQDRLFYSGAAVLWFVFGYVVTKPCRLLLRHSPWSYFANPERLRFLSWDDAWNWWFGLFVLLLSGASISALVAGITMRMRAAGVGPLSHASRRLLVVVVLVHIAGTVAWLWNLTKYPMPPGGRSLEGLWPIASLVGPDLLIIASIIWIARPGRREWKRIKRFADVMFRRRPTASPRKPLRSRVRQLTRMLNTSSTPAPGDRVARGIDVAIAMFFFCLGAAIYLDPVDTANDFVVRVWCAAILALLSLFIIDVVDAAALATVLEADAVKNPPPRIIRFLNGMLRSKLAILACPILASAGFLIFELGFSSPREPYTSLLYLERAVNLGNGVSPLVPVTLVGAAAGAWLVCQLRRVDYLRRFARGPVTDPRMNPTELMLDKLPPFTVATARKQRLLERSASIRSLLNSTMPREFHKNPACLVVIGLTIVAIARLLERFVPAVDGLVFSWAMMVAFAALIAATVVTLCRFLLVWWSVRRLLHEFALMPMQRAFDRMPPSLSREFGPFLNSLDPRLENLELTVRQWARVAEGFDESALAKGLFDRAGLEMDQEQRDRCLTELKLRFCGALTRAEANGTPGLRILSRFERECRDAETSWCPGKSETWLRLRVAAGACISVLVPYWQKRSLDEGYGESKNKKQAAAEEVSAESARSAFVTPSSTSTRKAETVWMGRASRLGTLATLPFAASPFLSGSSGMNGSYDEEAAESWTASTKAWLLEVEDFLTLALVNFVSECTIHLKNMAGFLAVGPFLLLLAASSYPFQPQRFLVVTIWTLLIAVAAGVLWAYLQLERNEVLSRVAKTTPGKVAFTWPFITQAAAVVVPLLGALLGQFPFVADAIYQWLDPIFRIIR